MILALLLTLSVAFALAYFAKSVLIRQPLHSSESSTLGDSGFTSARPSNADQLRNRSTQPTNKARDEGAEPKTTVMQPPVSDLAPPKDDPFTVEQLASFDGSDPCKPIYVAIKGIIFDVTRKGDVYGKGNSYNLFAGKDASRALGKSSLKEEDAVSDYSTLDEADMKTLNDWHAFFLKRYNIVGKVIDLPPMSNPLPEFPTAPSSS